MSDDQTSNYRCPFTLDWVRQATDVESGRQLSLFDRLHLPLVSSASPRPAVTITCAPELAGETGLSKKDHDEEC